MKKYYLFLIIIFIFCSPNEDEIQARIDAAISQAKIENQRPDTTTQINASTTTLQEATTTTLKEIKFQKIDYEQNIDLNSFFLYFTEFRNTSVNEREYLQLKGYWNEARSLIIYFENDCEVYSEFKYSRTGKSLGTLAINILEEMNKDINCSNETIVSYMRVMQLQEGKTSETNYLYLLDTGEYFSGYYNTTKENTLVYCCHSMDFQELNQKIQEILNK